MDLSSNRKLLKGKNNSSIGEAEDRISGLPDEILHHILSFLDIKLIVRTCVLSKRWNVIWTSMPILKFPYCSNYSLSQTNDLMDFVDATLLLRDASSNIEKIHLNTNIHFNVFRVHSWISNITKRNNVKEINLDLQFIKPFSIPSSLFTCESLTKLELCASRAIRIRRSFSFPKLKSLQLSGIQFDGWNAQHFSNCPVIEKLIFENCTWHGMKKFCIVTPVLKLLEFQNSDTRKDGLQDCDLKIHAPNLVSLRYDNGVAKDYDLSSFVKLEYAQIIFKKYDGDERIGLGAAVSKFFLALSHVQSLEIDANGVEAVLGADNFVNVLPTFHNLNKLELILGPASDEVIFALFKAAPNLKRLHFWDDVLWSEGDGRVFDETQELFRHLQSVEGHFGNLREFRWVKLILKNAKSSLQTLNMWNLVLTLPKTKM